jgi:Na+(H+)/acetate symporter ActP
MMNSHRRRGRLPMLISVVLVAVLMLLTAGYGGLAQEGPWHTVRKYCLLALLVITWVLIAACVVGGADLCVHLARRLGLNRPEEIIADTVDSPATEIKSV